MNLTPLHSPALGAPTLPTPAQKIRRRPQVLERFGISAATLYRWIERDGFPRPIKLGGHSVGWIDSEIEEWVSSRARTGAQSADCESA